MIRSACSDAPGLFRLFVYGTLKRNRWNHETFCSEAVSIQDAKVRGRLYEFPSGIPVLEVPEQDIITHGSPDIPNDLALQYRLGANPTGHIECSGGKWQQIEGELITLSNPVITVPPIDRLEGFHPNGTSLYRRVLLPVKLSGECVTTAWCYVASSATARMLTPTPLTRWG